MLHVIGLTYRLGERLLIDAATARAADRRTSRAGRPQRRRQDHALPPDPRRTPARKRLDRAAKGARLGSVEQEAPGGAER